MNVLSLFDGMSCGRVALERCGFKIDKYYASEIDKYAITVAANNYLDTIHVGDVTKVRAEDLDPIDLLIGGSPCQGFSFAGKQLNFEDPRSKLFFEFVRLVKECKPKYFFLENVVMKKEFQDVISSYLGVQPIFLNSATVSAQNRKRLYWTNITGYTEPKDKGVTLEKIEGAGDYNLKGYDHLTIKFDKPGFPAGSKRLDFINSKLYETKKGNLTVLAADIEGDTPSGVSRQIDRVYCVKGKGPCLTKFDNRIKITDPVSREIRYLSMEGYERMQTVDPGYTAGVPERKRREMLGNGWTVDAVCEFFKHIPKDLDLF